MAHVGSIKSAAKDAINAANAIFSKSKPGRGSSCAASSRQICPGKDNKEIRKALDAQATMLQKKKKELDKWDDAAKKHFEKWFGTTGKAARKKIQNRIDKMIELNKNTKVANIKKANPSEDGVFAYVHPNDKTHTVYVDKAFCAAALTGQDSKAGTLCHEMSHFADIGGTKDHRYGVKDSKALAQSYSDKALQNADNFEYYMENVH